MLATFSVKTFSLFVLSATTDSLVHWQRI